ncbi:uncharacterized protein TNCV_1547011 [Trichonephila clavipes]|nr:uncharacterized protein TNCV_1547011 [Trichonephila clavipes]
MSFLLKGEKEDLLELTTELGLEATVDMTKPMLKNLITKSAGYDEEDTKLMCEGIVEERKQRELIEERKRRENLECDEEDNIPVYQTARRLSYAEKKSVNKHIEEKLEQGIVRPSSSEYASPIVLVKNKKTYNKKKEKAPEYQVGDLVAVQRTQFGGGLKLRPEFFGPNQITEVKLRDRYTVQKVRDHAGPNVTATSADLIKYFSH